MNHQLTSTQAFWLGHLHHAFSVGQSLSHYADEQGLCFADLMAWRQRLMVQRIAVPDMHRPNRFVSVAVAIVNIPVLVAPRIRVFRPVVFCQTFQCRRVFR